MASRNSEPFTSWGATAATEKLLSPSWQSPSTASEAGKPSATSPFRKGLEAVGVHGVAADLRTELLVEIAGVVVRTAAAGEGGGVPSCGACGGALDRGALTSDPVSFYEQTLVKLWGGLLSHPSRARRGGAGIALTGEDCEPREFVGLPERDWRALRGTRIGLIPQDPTSSLDPVRTIGASVAEPLRIHGWRDRDRIAQRVLELLEHVGLDDPATRGGSTRTSSPAACASGC